MADLAGVLVLGNDWPHHLTRKICGMIALASLVCDAGTMAHLASRLATEVAAPLTTRETDASQDMGGGLVTWHFGILAKLCIQKQLDLNNPNQRRIPIRGRRILVLHFQYRYKWFYTRILSRCRASIL